MYHQATSQDCESQISNIRTDQYQLPLLVITSYLTATSAISSCTDRSAAHAPLHVVTCSPTGSFSHAIMHTAIRLPQATRLLTLLSLYHIAQHANGKTLPVFDPTATGAEPKPTAGASLADTPPGTTVITQGLPKAQAVQNFVMLFDSKHSGPSLPGASAAIKKAQGSVIAQHPAIAVIIASSASATFAGDMMASDSRLTHVSAVPDAQLYRRRKVSKKVSKEVSEDISVPSCRKCGSSFQGGASSEEDSIRDDVASGYKGAPSKTGLDSGTSKGGNEISQEELDITPTPDDPLEIAQHHHHQQQQQQQRALLTSQSATVTTANQTPLLQEGHAEGTASQDTNPPAGVRTCYEISRTVIHMENSLKPIKYLRTGFIIGFQCTSH